MERPWYQTAYRRILVDMHIPDWDEGFLAKYDPRVMVECYERAGVTAVMFYCQSHVGLCYWPTRTGKMHAGIRGHDVVGELLSLLKERCIATCAYYSVNYNNWAFWQHPEWRIQPCGDQSAESFSHSRYGTCCLNNPGYRAFVLAQVEELVGAYDFDGFFFDDTFWPTVCVCPHCRLLFRQDTGKEIPTLIDWNDPTWCKFQAEREQWLSEYVRMLTGKAKSIKPAMTVYHNFGVALGHWAFGVPFESARHHDYLGGDLFGDSLEQLTVIKWMLNLSEHRPAEFMTSHTIGVREHVQLKSFEQMQLQALAAMALGSAFLFIDWINPDGSVIPGVYERIGRVYAELAPYEPYMGGEPVEDIAIYFSYDSKVDFADNGRPLRDVDPWSELAKLPPHLRAVRGVCRNLQCSHLPFGIITRKQLAHLERYKLVVLPNLLRMDAGEVAAFRDYVRRGGKLYASRYTSLTETSGVRYSDFMLADVFGCHLSADDVGAMSYLKPYDLSLANWIAPQDYVSLSTELVMFGPLKDKPPIKPLRLAVQAEGTRLATLTLPYRNNTTGAVFDQNWSSIHSSPPWEDTDHPVIVSHAFGAGGAIYCAADIESLDAEAPNRLFLGLIRSLMDTPPTYSAEAHPAVWMNVFRQPENQRCLVAFLNYQIQWPVIPIPHLSFSLRPPTGQHFTRLQLLPDKMDVEFTADADGTLHAEVNNLNVLQLLIAETAPHLSPR